MTNLIGKKIEIESVQARRRTAIWDNFMKLNLINEIDELVKSSHDNRFLIEK